MKNKRITDAQIVGILKQAKSGAPLKQFRCDPGNARDSSQRTGDFEAQAIGGRRAFERKQNKKFVGKKKNLKLSCAQYPQALVNARHRRVGGVVTQRIANPKPQPKISTT